MIDKDKIFQLFVDGKGIQDDKTKSEIKDFMNGPYAKIGMFVKLIQNHKIFHQKLEKFLKQEQPSYNVESTKEASEFTVYHRAWNFIQQLNLDNEEDMKAVKNFNPKIFYKVLGEAVKYFESLEDYKKCSHIFAIQEAVKNNLDV